MKERASFALSFSLGVDRILSTAPIDRNVHHHARVGGFGHSALWWSCATLLSALTLPWSRSATRCPRIRRRRDRCSADYPILARRGCGGAGGRSALPVPKPASLPPRGAADVHRRRRRARGIRGPRRGQRPALRRRRGRNRPRLPDRGRSGAVVQRLAAGRTVRGRRDRVDGGLRRRFHRLPSHHGVGEQCLGQRGVHLGRVP